MCMYDMCVVCVCLCTKIANWFTSNCTEGLLPSFRSFFKTPYLHYSGGRGGIKIVSAISGWYSTCQPYIALSDIRTPSQLCYPARLRARLITRSQLNEVTE